MQRPDAVLIDTNAVIEAVRTGCWAAITGQLAVETVQACRDELLAGSASELPGYVPVGEEHLERLRAVHEVDEVTRAEFKLAYTGADGLDAGEHDLLAHAHAMASGDWVLCSPDKASIRAAVSLGHGDRLRALEKLIQMVGASAKPPIA